MNYASQRRETWHCKVEQLGETQKSNGFSCIYETLRKFIKKFALGRNFCESSPTFVRKTSWKIMNTFIYFHVHDILSKEGKFDYCETSTHENHLDFLTGLCTDIHPIFGTDVYWRQIPQAYFFSQQKKSLPTKLSLRLTNSILDSCHQVVSDHLQNPQL